MAVTVEEFIPGVHEKPHLTVKSDKFKNHFTIKPTQDGYVFYGIFVASGSVPKELQGRYSSMKKALEDLTRYERHATKTATVKRDENTKAKQKAKAE